MAVTFEEARQIVDDAERAEWARTYEPGDGTFMVAEWGFENATHYNVIVGFREFLVDDDDDYMQVGVATRLVNKETGVLTYEAPYLVALPIAAVLDAMTPVGSSPWANTTN